MSTIGLSTFAESSLQERLDSRRDNANAKRPSDVKKLWRMLKSNCKKQG